MSGMSSGPASPFVDDRHNYFTFLDSLSILVWLVDSHDRCSFSNRAALEFLGKAQEDVRTLG
ncbi:MAG: PAS domain-containing protein, partial [Candidatus Acidiferrales bacterium]